MTERLKWPCAALLLGILGGVLRRWQMNTAFEPELGLCDPGAPACIAMMAFVFLPAALFLMLANAAPARTWREKEARLSLWDQSFAAKGDVVYLLLMALAGVLTLAAAPFLLRDAMAISAASKAAGGGDNPVLQLVLALCALPGGAGYVLIGRFAAKMEGDARKNGLLLLPGLLNCVWLLEGYRSNAADPVLWDYVPLLFAVALGLLLQVECAAMAYDAGRPRRMLWLAGMTAVMSAAVMGGGPATPDLLLLAGQTLCALAALWIAPGRLARPPRKDRFAPPGEPEQQEPERDEGPEEEQDGEVPASEHDDKMEDTTHGQ